ncbi:hypothetical protein C2G38_2159132 [Gigaspora rosea]|uniref:Uncharacterized protein n=1 Tax=Gigaspora rosea TaxID=44941 RepID=A0A397W1F0_9GLOM|nr:hypothetical protein C2G38_2159132 [Gigaspora rosea]
MPTIPMMTPSTTPTMVPKLKSESYKGHAIYHKLAEMGHAGGINAVRECYRYGKGIEKNERKAQQSQKKDNSTYQKM